jgi:hypothetical protein
VGHFQEGEQHVSDKWFIIQRAQSDTFESYKAISETAKTVSGKQPRWPHVSQFRKGAVLMWFDNAESADALVQRLQSSVSLMRQEQRKCAERHAERAAKLLGKATQTEGKQDT